MSLMINKLIFLLTKTNKLNSLQIDFFRFKRMFFFLFVATCLAAVAISEIMYNGPTGGKQAYIELYNNETADVSLYSKQFSKKNCVKFSFVDFFRLVR